MIDAGLLTLRPDRRRMSHKELEFDMSNCDSCFEFEPKRMMPCLIPKQKFNLDANQTVLQSKAIINE